MEPMKICVGASAGGHMNELNSLLKHSKLWPAKPSVYLTTQNLQADKLKKLGKTYVVGECNRTKPFSVFSVFIIGFKVMMREKPDVIITTGSLPIAIVCVVAKFFFKKRVIWIDSVAQTRDLSMSGKMMYSFADLFFTQWPEVAAKYRKARFAGALL